MTLSSSSHSYVVMIDLTRADQLRQDLQERGFEITNAPYARFSAKKKGLSCVLYTSGRFLVQGKECAEFVEFYLEPEILRTLSFRHPLAQIDLTPRIGIDESGKGDFFGPLCIAGVYVKEEEFASLQALGVKDSKCLTESSIRKLANEIRKHCLYHVVRINPLKYNQIYASFRNLNRLLAWGHATTIEQLVEQSGCSQVIIDQFADESVVEQALKRKKLVVKLTQRHRAEEDLAVAAASILARHAFVEGLERLSQDLGIELPKGSSKATQLAAETILRKWGEEKLKGLCKQHFKTFNAILTQRYPNSPLENCL